MQNNFNRQQHNNRQQQEAIRLHQVRTGIYSGLNKPKPKKNTGGFWSSVRKRFGL